MQARVQGHVSRGDQLAANVPASVSSRISVRSMTMSGSSCAVVGAMTVWAATDARTPLPIREPGMDVGGDVTPTAAHPGMRLVPQW